MNDQLALQNLLAWTLQIVVIVPAAALLPRLLRMHSPVVRHAYWRVLLGVCLCLPVVQPWHPLAPVPVETPMAATAPAVPGAAAVVTTASPKAPVPPPRLNWRGSILPMIALVALARIGWLAAGVWRLRRIRASAKDGLPSDAEELEGLDVGRAQICYVRGICQPVTFGLRRPAICLPESLRAKPVAMRRVVIAHELWHVRRNDWPWLAAEEVLRSLFWFHPAIVWLVSRIQQTREEVVDELTVLQTRAKRAYVEALLAFADEPAPLAAAPFARRRHLVHRIGLLSREAVMSSKRVVAFVVAVLAVVALASVYATTRFPLTAATDVGQTAAPQVPPRDPRPATASRPGDREAALRTAIASQPDLPNNYIELAGLQEERGAYPEAEATLAAARSAVPNNTVLLRAIAGYYNRQGDFAKTMEALEAVADIDPTDPVRHQIVATYYWEKAYKDQRLPASVKQEYIDKGIAATDRALAADPNAVDALSYKNLLLRLRASGETDAVKRAQWLAEADAVRGRAMEIKKATAPPPPPPPPPAPSAPDAPVRVGGDIAAPKKVKDADPVYPPIAQKARVAGVVVVEALIGPTGRVQSASVVRSIPLLDGAALDAVRQWEFEPTLVNGRAVPVAMRLTVPFTPK